MTLHSVYMYKTFQEPQQTYIILVIVNFVCMIAWVIQGNCDAEIMWESQKIRKFPHDSTVSGNKWHAHAIGTQY